MSPARLVPGHQIDNPTRFGARTKASSSLYYVSAHFHTMTTTKEYIYEEAWILTLHPSSASPFFVSFLSLLLHSSHPCGSRKTAMFLPEFKPVIRNGKRV